MERLVTTTYLEMRARSQLRRAAEPGTPFEFTRLETPDPELSRFLYATVGAEWTWHMRLPWTRDEWLAYLDRPELETWVARVHDAVAGYAELERDGHDVQIVYFGLLPAFIGQRMGGALLTRVIECAWDMGARRVWVHTCDLDHPHALANYQARGMQIYRTDRTTEALPDRG